MARPSAKNLTERELEVMHVFWKRGESTVAEARDEMAESGRDLAYTTVATLVRILVEKDFLQQSNGARPFTYAPARTFEVVSENMLNDLVQRVFGGSRVELLRRLVEKRALTTQERDILADVLAGEQI